jgi:hypothetical protein
MPILIETPRVSVTVGIDGVDQAAPTAVHALPSQTLASHVRGSPVSLTPCSRLYFPAASRTLVRAPLPHLLSRHPPAGAEHRPQPNLNDLPQVHLTSSDLTSASGHGIMPFCTRHALLNTRALALGGAVDGKNDGYGLPGELQANFLKSTIVVADRHIAISFSSTDDDLGGMPVVDWDTPPPLEDVNPRLPVNLGGG